MTVEVIDNAIKQIDGEASLCKIDKAEETLEIKADGNAGLLTSSDGETELISNKPGETGFFMVIREGSYPVYTGETTITPSEETQTLSTDHKSILSNITVEAIPSNYGRLRWENNTLTVY